MQYLLFVGTVTSDWLTKADKASHPLIVIVPGCIAIILFLTGKSGTSLSKIFLKYDLF